MHSFIDHLVQDHNEQRKLGEQLKKAQLPEDRKKLRVKMSSELLPHMAGEEASIFSYMRAAGVEAANEHALEAIQEHHVARIVLQEILDLSPGSEVFSAKAAVLVELNKHHMEEEEGMHFPWLEANASKEQLDALFEDYKAAEKAAE